MRAAVEGQRIVVRALTQTLLGGQRRAALDEQHAAAQRQRAFGHQHARDAAAEHAEVGVTLE